MAYPSPHGYGYPPPSTDHYDAYSRSPGSFASEPGYPGYPPAGYPAHGEYPPSGSGFMPPGSFPPSSGGYLGGPPSGDLYGFGALPPGAYGQPPSFGYGPPPPGYGFPPGSNQSSRGRSPRRDRERSPRRRNDKNDGKRAGEKGGDKGSKGRDRRDNVNERGGKGKGDKGSKDKDTERPKVPQPDSNDPRVRCQHQLHQNSDWISVWLEGIDPPRRAATSSNVTVLIVDNPKLTTDDGSNNHGFLLAHSRASARKRDRERECSKEMSALLEALPMKEHKAWCQIPITTPTKRLLDVGELERLTASVQTRCPDTTVDLPEPMVCVVVGAQGFPAIERSASSLEPDMNILDRFEPGFGELMTEARRVNGLVRRQWFLAAVNVRKKGASTPFVLGSGFATDRESARVRAVHAAEIRAQFLSEALLTKIIGEKDAFVQEQMPSQSNSNTQS